MALISPGVQVNVIDESFYTPAEPGTIPIIFVATKENKTNPAGSGIASGTLASNAGKVYLISSQRELSETFGDPLFYTDSNNNPIHGGEQNEYGLQAAYSYLGVSNRVYVVRANIDLGSINALETAPAGKPSNGSYWLNLSRTLFGLFEWNSSPITVTNGQSFTNKVPTVITDTSQVVNFLGADYTPKNSIGKAGDYVIVSVTNVNRLWYKNSSNIWVAVGSSAWKASHPFVIGTGTGNININRTLTFSLTTDSSGTQYDVTTTGTTITSLASDINNAASLVSAGITASVVSGRLALYNNGTTSEVVEIYGDDATFTALGITQGDYYAPSVTIAPHTSIPLYKTTDPNPRPTGSIWIKTTNPNLGANWNVRIYNSSTSLWTDVNAPIYANNHSAIYGYDTTGGLNIPEGAIYVQSNSSENSNPLADFKIFRKNGSGAVVATSTKILASTWAAGSYSFTISESITGQSNLDTPKTVTFVATGATTDSEVFVAALNAVGLTNVSASIDSQNKISISHSLGGEIRLVDTTGGLDNIFTPFVSTDPNSTTNLYYTPGTDISTSPKQFIITHWKSLVFTAKATEPTDTITEDNKIWYSSRFDEIDIMVHNGTTWVGYQDATAYPSTDPNGPIVSSTEPTQQSDGSSLVNNDLWISTADITNYPIIYRYNTILAKWIQLDKTDQTTENGILFADARYNTTGANSNEPGSIVNLLASNFLDPDAPNPALYPKGMLLWNLRRSGFNVKRFERNYINVNSENTRFNDESMTGYFPHRWVTESANNEDGSGSFGRSAQRKVVVQSLQALVNSNEDIRDDESRLFNLIACPNYPELIGEMINLNVDRGITAFVVGDSPMTLAPNTTSLNNWANNLNGSIENNDRGLVTRNEYLGVYYPSGFTSDNAGRNIVVPASHMVLRAIALNDQVAYPWFAPAGTRRGNVTNADSVGYIDSNGEFKSVALNEGQRDTLYQAGVNPITFLSGAGLTIYGQKTRATIPSSMDRINVSRLVIYLRSQLKTLAKPYIFEPNDKITRDEIRQQVETLMIELIGLRAIYDYLVVCDETNNTPARIDRNELYVDIAIEPVKAIEFIYIPLR